VKDGDKIDPNNLFYDNFSEYDDFSQLDFTDPDGSDPLEIDKYIKSNPSKYVKNKISTIYSVKYNNKPIAYFTLSMAAIKTQHLLEEDIDNQIEFQQYPAMLLGRMGVDKKHQNQGVGESILLHCLGLAQEINNDIACAVLMLHTNQSKAGYYRKRGFKTTEEQSRKERPLMYRRV
jgi:GNAT superfamily N-acetyltransferase